MGKRGCPSDGTSGRSSARCCRGAGRFGFAWMARFSARMCCSGSAHGRLATPSRCPSIAGSICSSKRSWRRRSQSPRRLRSSRVGCRSILGELRKNCREADRCRHRPPRLPLEGPGAFTCVMLPACACHATAIGGVALFRPGLQSPRVARMTASRSTRCQNTGDGLRFLDSH